MNNLQKFFKKRDDDILDMQTLSTVSHAELCQLVIKFHSELRVASQMIETQEESTKQLKKDLSKAIEEQQLYKTHCEGLQNLAQKLSLENESFNTIIESKNQEVKYFREKNTELEKNSENVKNTNVIIAELDTFKQKHKESLDKISAMISEKELNIKEKINRDNEIKVLKERYEESVKKILEYENSIKTKTELYQNCKSENKTMKNTLKDLQNKTKDMEAIINGKNQRISELEANCSTLTAQVSEKTYRLESFDLKYDNLKESLHKEISEKNATIIQLHEKIEKEITAKIEENKSLFYKNIEEYKIKITSLEIERSNNLSTILNLTKQTQELESSLKICKENLEVSQKKRELAKEEVIKLTQKLENNSHDRTPVKPSHSILPPTVTNTISIAEHKALQVLKGQLDTLYKSLMEIMLTAGTSREAITKVIQYQIPSEEFSKFEKDLNKIVMNAHEAAENPNFIEHGPGWMGRISSWAPSKLLSCMNSDTRAHTNNAPEKRRASYKGFF